MLKRIRGSPDRFTAILQTLSRQHTSDLMRTQQHGCLGTAFILKGISHRDTLITHQLTDPSPGLKPRYSGQQDAAIRSSIIRCHTDYVMIPFAARIGIHPIREVRAVSYITVAILTFEIAFTVRRSAGVKRAWQVALVGLSVFTIACSLLPSSQPLSHDFQVAGRRAKGAIDNEFMQLNDAIPYDEDLTRPAARNLAFRTFMRRRQAAQLEVQSALQEADVQRANSSDKAAYDMLKNAESSVDAMMFDFFMLQVTGSHSVQCKDIPCSKMEMVCMADVSTVLDSGRLIRSSCAPLPQPVETTPPKAAVPVPQSGSYSAHPNTRIYDVATIRSEFLNNEPQATAIHKGTVVFIKGITGQLLTNPNTGDHIILLLDLNTHDTFVACHMNNADLSHLANRSKPGAIVVLSGECLGWIDGTVLFSNCQLVS